MIRVYFRQAWIMLKQNRLFSSVYIVGTGLSIALVMVLFVIYYVKAGPVYPEYNRDRMLVIKTMKSQDKGSNGTSCNTGVSYFVAKTLLKDLPHLDQIAVFQGGWGKMRVDLPGNQGSQEIQPGYVDCGFWSMFSFRFLSGKPFVQADVDSRLPVAVISESLARKLFATTDATGKYLSVNAERIRVCGVVKDVSYATPTTVADLWMPMTRCPAFDDKDPDGRLNGAFWIYLTAPTRAEKKQLRAEVQDAFRRYNAQDHPYVSDLMEQPDDYWKSSLRTDCMGAPDVKQTVRQLAYILLALLFIPALNLGGLISSRMDRRLGELGVRRAYGATSRMLVNQVLWENLLLTLLGGVAGMLVSWGILLSARGWILSLGTAKWGGIPYSDASLFLGPEVLFNPYVFATAFLVCLFLNVLSALIPALWALRHSIVNSLHAQR